MSSDLEAMLRRAVRDVFGEHLGEVAWQTEAGGHVSRVTLSAERGTGRRTVELMASTTGWLQATIINLGVAAVVIEDDDDSHMEMVLREMALLAHAYLSGEGRLVYKRGLLRRRPVLTVIVNGKGWTLGRRVSSAPY